MKTVCITLLFLFPFMAFAADEEKQSDVKTAGDKTVASEPATSDHSMLRQEAVLKGFQPLTVAGQEIDATYLEETLGDNHGVIVFLHDQGDQLENEVVTPLRQTFPEYGWSTLTLALYYPYKAKIYLATDEETAQEDEKAEESEKVAAEEETQTTAEDKSADKPVLPPVANIARMQAALEFVQSKNIKRIIFVGHGAGGDLAIELLEKLTIEVSALVLIGTAQLTTDQVFETLKFPILDIIGSNDDDDVKPAAKHRKKLMKQAGNNHYDLREVTGADHVFYGLQPQLNITLRSWLNKYFVEEVTE